MVGPAKERNSAQPPLLVDTYYIDAVRLRLEAIPVVFEERRFAMKGGTALNLFVQDLPRLSVDIDVVFTDYTPSSCWVWCAANPWGSPISPR